jgi:hypothetical protein
MLLGETVQALAAQAILIGISLWGRQRQPHTFLHAPAGAGRIASKLGSAGGADELSLRTT